MPAMETFGLSLRETWNEDEDAIIVILEKSSFYRFCLIVYKRGLCLEVDFFKSYSQNATEGVGII